MYAPGAVKCERLDSGVESIEMESHLSYAITRVVIAVVSATSSTSISTISLLLICVSFM